MGIEPYARYGIGIDGGVESLLQVAGGIDATLRTVIDGEAAASILQLSTAQVNINATPGDHSSAPSLSFGDANTGLYESADNTIRIAVNGNARWIIGNSTLGTANTARAQIGNTDPTSTTPNILPNGEDTNTGIGWTAADQLSLIAGGVEGIRLHEATSVWVVQRTPASAPADATLIVSSAGFYLDEAGNNLMVKVKYADTTVKSGTVCAVA